MISWLYSFCDDIEKQVVQISGCHGCIDFIHNPRKRKLLDETASTEHPLSLLTLAIYQINRSQNIALIRLDDVPIHNHFIQQKMNLF